MRLSKSCYALQNLYFVPPWGVNAGFIVGSRKTVIIDTGCNSDSAKTIFGYAKAVKDNNDFLVINTEKHLDHIGGNSFFREKNIEIIGHKSINRNQSDLEGLLGACSSLIEEKRQNASEEKILLYQNITNPDTFIDEKTIMNLGDSSVEILMTPGHTDSNISVYLPKEKVLFVGDCIVNKFIPNLEDGNREDWNRWIESLSLLESLDIDKIVPGHGPVLEDKESIGIQINRIKGILREGIKS